MLRKGIARWAARLAAWPGMLPSCCGVCHAWPARPVCERCRDRFAAAVPRCATCALPVSCGVTHCGACLRETSRLDGCIAAVDYSWPWPSLIGCFKFGGQPGWAQPLAQLMAQAAGARERLGCVDHVLPMPLAPARLAERGYNQAHELARRLARAKVRPAWLLRVRDTLPQAGLAARQRRSNVAHAFALEPAATAHVAGSRVLLVDDVMTTGASLAGCAAVLRQAGAREVHALVLARTAAD